MARGSAVDRARADVERGDLAAARHRLKGYLVDRPTDLEARRLLADLYRREGRPDAAGQWGYLVPDGADPRERTLFERSCRYRRRSQWTATSTLVALAWPEDVPAPDERTAVLLMRLRENAAAERAAWEERMHPAPVSVVDRVARLLRRSTRAQSSRTQGSGDPAR